MTSLLAKLFSWLLSRLFNTSPPPSQEAKQADRAAVAETKLATESQTALVQSAIAKAEANAPRDTEGVVKVLEKGEF